MRFTFFKSLTLAAAVALNASAVDVDLSDYEDSLYELAQLYSGIEDDGQELPEPATLPQTTAESHSHTHNHSLADSHSHAHSHVHSHSHADLDLEAELDSDSDLDAELDSDSEGEEFDFAQVSDEDFYNMLAQIENKIDEQEQEHVILLAEVAEYLSTLDHGDIDAMEAYLAQVEGTEGLSDEDQLMLAQTEALDDDLIQVAEFLAQLDEEDLDVIQTILA